MLGISNEVNELLDEICFMDAPYETRVEMAEALVKAVRSGEILKEVKNNVT